MAQHYGEHSGFAAQGAQRCLPLFVGELMLLYVFFVDALSNVTV